MKKRYIIPWAVLFVPYLLLSADVETATGHAGLFLTYVTVTTGICLYVKLFEV